MAICQAASVARDYTPLSNPVLATFEEAINESVASVEVPPFEPQSGNQIRNQQQLAEYNQQVKDFQTSPDLYHKALNLRSLSRLRSNFVEDVLTKSKEKLSVDSNEEAKAKILEACDGLYDLVETIMENDIHPRGIDQKKPVEEIALKTIGFDIFCRFLK